MTNECTNISIDLTNAQVICSYKNGSTLRLDTDLFLMCDFDLVRASQHRIIKALKKKERQKRFQIDGPEQLAIQHTRTLDFHNGLSVKKQRVNRTP
jgi:hypothetical protein